MCKVAGIDPKTTAHDMSQAHPQALQTLGQGKIMAQTGIATGTVAGFFESNDDAGRAVQELKDAGFTSGQIGVARRGGSTGAQTGTQGHAGTQMAHAAGAKTEGVWDKVKNFFDGGDVEPYADERSNGDLASREVTPGGGSTANTAYGAPDLHGTMTDLSVSEDRSKYMSHRFGNSSAGAVVTVKAEGRAAEAEQIFKSCGGDLGNDSADYDYANTSTSAAVGGEQNIQLLGEVLRVHTDRVSLGDVRLRKEVVTEMQTVQVPVTREELVIERHAVAGNTAANGQIGDANEIRIPLSEERASIDKSTVVREEVSVGKRSVEDVREVSNEVRHEELIVDDQTKAGRTR